MAQRLPANQQHARDVEAAPAGRRAGGRQGSARDRRLNVAVGDGGPGPTSRNDCRGLRFGHSTVAGLEPGKLHASLI
jgi:hypothetical protein